MHIGIHPTFNSHSLWPRARVMTTISNIPSVDEAHTLGPVVERLNQA